MASEIQRLAKLGRWMPPSWNGAGVSHPVMSRDGAFLGKIMPGRGLYLDCDLKYLGITRPIPYVFEKTRTRKLIDFFKNERRGVAAAAMVLAASLSPKYLWPLTFGAVQVYDDIINARCGGNYFDSTFVKFSVTSAVNKWTSLLTAGGDPPAVTFSNIPGGSAFDNSANTSLIFGTVGTVPTGKKQYLTTFGYITGTAQNTMLLMDLLVAAGNINATITTSQTVNTTALTRYTSGNGVLMCLEITGGLGATTANATIGYTSAGTAGRSITQQYTGNTAVTNLCPQMVPYFFFQSGDYGVQSVQTIQFSSANTGGTLCLELYFPLTFVPGIAANSWVERDIAIQLTGIKELVQTTGQNIGHLGLFLFNSASSTGNVYGMIRSVQG